MNPETNLPDPTHADASPRESEAPPVVPPPQPPRRTASYWVKRLLWRNPFYLASAALFLFGISQLSLDPNFLGAEERKLVFNFTALQVYELLLVAIAVFLARRRIWYDSTLLAVLESGFVLVQFIFVTHAALIGSKLAWPLGLIGTALAVGRFGVMRRCMPQLNLPLRLLLCGGVVLLANFIVPFFFRWTLEDGTPDWDDWNLYAWFCALPALQLLAGLLPKPDHSRPLDSQRPWLPFLMFSLGLAATAVHVRCVDYFATLPFQFYVLAPLAWTFAWTAWVRVGDFASQPGNMLKATLLCLPALATTVAAFGSDSRLFFALTALNVLAYLALSLAGMQRRIAAELLLGSCAALFAALPETWGQALLAEFSRGRLVAAAAVGYLGLRAFFTARCEVGLAGALAVACLPAFFFRPETVDPLGQLGLVYLLVHSLRWADDRQEVAPVFRAIGGLLWAVHSVAWTSRGGWESTWFVTSGALALLAAYALLWRVRSRRGPLIIPVAAMVSLLASPVEFCVTRLKTAPPGVLAVLGSFVLLALGTVVALAKHRWDQPASVPPGPDEGQ